MDKRPAFGTAIFCDDIRSEEGGKITLVGTYANIMLIHRDFPVMLAKFGVAIRYSERLDIFGASDVKLRIFIEGDDTPLTEGEIPMRDLAKRLDRSEYARPGLPPLEYAHCGLNVMFSPLVIPRECLIRARAIRGNDVIPLGALRVLRSKASEQTQS